LCGGLVW